MIVNTMKKGKHNTEPIYFIHNGHSKYLLLTSLDLVYFTVHKSEYIKSIIQIDEFSDLFVSNLVKLLLFYIPSKHEIEILLSDQKIKDITGKIKYHFLNYYCYRIEKSDKYFHDILLNYEN